MAAAVYFAELLPAVGQTTLLDGDEGRHAQAVRRTRVGEHLALTDGVGHFAFCVVDQLAKNTLTLRCEQLVAVPAASPEIVVVQAIPKSDRAELAVELATEAGADVIIPWQAQRCVARWDGKADKALTKWRSAAREASKQSRRAWLPDVTAPMTSAALTAYVHQANSAGARIFALHEAATQSLAHADLAGASQVVLIVGPEGGIAPTEIDQLEAAGAQQVVLGPTVLRTSTAAAVALGALGVLTRRWQNAPVPATIEPDSIAVLGFPEKSTPGIGQDR